jgi:hypothetical protein
MKQTNFLLVFTIASLLITKPVSPKEDGSTLKKAKERNLPEIEGTENPNNITNTEGQSTTATNKAENKNSANSTTTNESDFFNSLIKQFTDKSGCEVVLKNLADGVNDCSKEHPKNKSLTKFICYKESAEDIILEMRRDFFNFEIVLKKIYDPIKNIWHIDFPINEHLSAFCKTESDQIDKNISKIVLEALEKSIENINKNEKNDLIDLEIEKDNNTITFKKATGDKNTNVDIYKISYTINSENVPYSVNFASLLFENTLEFTKSDKKFIEDEVDRALPNVIKQCMDSFRLIKSSSEAVTETHKLKCSDILGSFKSLTMYIKKDVKMIDLSNQEWPIMISCPIGKNADSAPRETIKFQIACHEEKLVDTMLNYNVLILKEEEKKIIFEISLLQESFSDMEVHALRFKRSTEEFLRYACPLGIQPAAKEI